MYLNWNGLIINIVTSQLQAKQGLGFRLGPLGLCVEGSGRFAHLRFEMTSMGVKGRLSGFFTLAN